MDLDTLVGRQRGLVSRRQVLAAGLDDESIRREIHAGHWQRLLPGIYACFNGSVTLEHRRVAAMLYAPGGAQLTGVAALRWHGFRYLPQDDRIQLLIPHQSRRTARGFVHFQRTERLDQHHRRANGYAVCSVARAVADAARALNDLRAVRAIVAEAIQNGRTTIAALRRELDAAGSHRTHLFRVALKEVDTGARSAPEAELVDELSRSKVLPQVRWNRELIADDGSPLPTPDGWIDESGIALEVDSREYHLDPEGWQRTLRRHNELSARGALVLHFTPSEIRRGLGRVRRMIEQAHRERLASGTRTSIRMAE